MHPPGRMRRRMAYGLVVLAAVTFVLAAVAVAAHDPEAGTSAGEGDGGRRGPRRPRPPPRRRRPPPRRPRRGRPSPGAADVGDPYFPGMGNGGYDVHHYDLGLAWPRTPGASTAT